jgi:hypothetical protein
MKIYYDQKVDAASNPFNPETLEPFFLHLAPCCPDSLFEIYSVRDVLRKKEDHYGYT